MASSCHRTRSRRDFSKQSYHEVVKLIVKKPPSPRIHKPYVVHLFCSFLLSLHHSPDHPGKHSRPLSTTHYSVYRPQDIHPQPLHSPVLIGSPLALGDRRHLTSTVASPHIEEWEATVDLPYPAVKCVITTVTHVSREQRCWAVLLLGAFYDANDRILWHTEIFVGDKAEESEETYSISDTEEGKSSEFLTTSSVLKT